MILSHTHEQRGAAALLLAAVSFGGSHHADATIRVSDAAFVLITGLASAAFFARGGLESVDRSVACFRRSSAVNLSAALLFYAGCRLFRAAVTLPGEVQANLGVRMTVRAFDDFGGQKDAPASK